MVAGIKKTVLAVDDDRSMIAFLGMLINQIGYDFVGLHSGEECLAQIDEIAPVTRRVAGCDQNIAILLCPSCF